MAAGEFSINWRMQMIEFVCFIFHGISDIRPPCMRDCHMRVVTLLS